MKNSFETVMRGWNPPNSEKNYRTKISEWNGCERFSFIAIDQNERSFMGSVYSELRTSMPGSVTTVATGKQFSLFTREITAAAEIESRLQKAGYSEQQVTPQN